MRPNFAEWEVEIDAPAIEALMFQSHADEAAANVEKLPHVHPLR